MHNLAQSPMVTQMPQIVTYDPTNIYHQQGVLDQHSQQQLLAGRFFQMPQAVPQLVDTRLMDPNMQNQVYQNMGQYAMVQSEFPRFHC
jgi:hypothetical protein